MGQSQVKSNVSLSNNLTTLFNFRATLVLVPMRTICELFADDGKPRITAKKCPPLKIPAMRYVTAMYMYLAGKVLTPHSQNSRP